MAVSVTCTAPVNIAVVKYWGKRDEDLILPVNSSLSVTLGQDELRAKTTIAISSKFTEDRMWLNGKEQSVSAKRIQNVLREIRRRSKKRKLEEDGDKGVWKVHICSENNFPTAAGLASSAAGFACLVYTLAQVYGVEGDLSEVARQGSGSACRSVYGGFVQWQMGSLADGSDSLASQIAPANHWPQLRILILVVSDQKKHTGSTEGMQTSVATSELMKRRIEVVPGHMTAMTEAVLQRDFPKFAEITMKESNQFHAVCLDTYPPISYLTDVSRTIIRLVHCFNQREGQTKLAYTFDAGPNACLFLLEEDVPQVVSLVQHFFPPEDKENFVRGLPVNFPATVESDTKGIPLEPWPHAIKYAICTKTGEGPQTLDAQESLLDEEGMPL